MDKAIIGFEVHQPFRIRNDAYWNPRFKGNPLEKFFDITLNKEVFDRVKKKCYVPATNIILNSIEKGEYEGRDTKYFFSLSGTFLEQAERWGKEVLDLFKILASTKKVEFLAQTYYHSVTSLWEDKTEWREQIKDQIQAIKDYLGYSPKIFENTELLTNPTIIDEAEKMGFSGIMAEGKESILRGSSPNYVYKKKGRKIAMFFRNYQLSDDLAFRFSMRSWNQFPLTADKYASWIKDSPGQMINIFVDYETFGEHHWPESGILDFLRWLPEELNKRGVRMFTPSDLISDAYYEIDVNGTWSWADVNKDETSWLGNVMQWAYDEAVRRTEMISKELGGEYLKAWKYFTTSDNYYYLFVGGGGPAEVHSYFSSYSTPVDAFINEFYAINSFLDEELNKLNIRNDPFFFVKNGKRSVVAWNKKQFYDILKRDEGFKDNEKYLKEWLDNEEN
ncbi:alpha-amylase [Candidatus Acidianus copahuensis]|uniref:Alpha-amylase n=1 Tax=Candidatus Acidianus copahuensis TaxID=1160895 RepID=A0A031LJT0_9CREN|nr:glycoside hydrolase family 57 protein [Candidatus Acidianus copahuensis]EZQ01745.1 alpha-amylase [Candidatus Acidianus copahuensis]